MKWFVLHPNGHRYGPADEPELREWLAEKRAKPETEVEDAETGLRSTVAEVLGLTPEIVIPDLTLQTASTPEPPAALAPLTQPVEPLQPVAFEFPNDKPAVLKSTIDDRIKPKPIVPPIQEKPAYELPPNLKTIERNLAVDACLMSFFGVVLFCCIPMPLIGIILASKARAKGLKGATAALWFSIAMLAATVAFWLDVVIK